MKIYKVSFDGLGTGDCLQLVGFYTSLDTVKEIALNKRRWQNKLKIQEFETDMPWAEGADSPPSNQAGHYILARILLEE